MAKIRSLKGEFFRNADVSRAGFVAKTLAAGLICAVADDEGRFKAPADYLHGEVFTHDSVSVEDVQTALERLDDVDFIRLYSVRGRVFGWLPTWNEHQRIPPTRFVKSKLPAPPKRKSRRQTAGIPQAAVVLARAPRSDRKGSEGIGEEGKGSEVSVTTSPHSADAETALVLKSEISVSPVVQVFRTWIASTGRSGKTLLDNKRQRLIARALAGYELEDILDAVDGWRFDAHHRGENDHGRPYNDLGLILRDPEHIERFRDFKRRPVAVVIPTGKPSMSAFYRDQAAKHAEAGD